MTGLCHASGTITPGAGLLLAAICASGEAAAGDGGSAPVPIVMHVVACAPDLLDCRDLEMPRMAFDDMGACRDRLAEVAAEARRRPAGPVVMGRCRHLLAEPERRRERLELAGRAAGGVGHASR